MDLSSCLCASTGACGVSVPHHLHGGGFLEGNSLRPALPPQRLPEERLESARLHHRSRRVSGRKRCEMFLYVALSESMEFDRGNDKDVSVVSFQGL